MHFPRFGLDRRTTAITLVLVSSAFVWYFLVFDILQYFLDSKTGATVFEEILFLGANVSGILVLSANVGAIVFAAIVGTLLIDKFKKRVSFLKRWMFVGIFVSIIPLIFIPSTNQELIVISLIFGLYFGLGMPVTMGYFSAVTENHNRARLSGLTFLVISLTFFVLGSLSTGSTIIAGFILVALRLATFVVFSLLQKQEVLSKDSVQSRYSNLITNRSFLLFLIPWLIFSLINYLTVPFTEKMAGWESFDQNISLYENILIAIFAVITGIFADRSGRKRLAIAGFVALGIGYAALGLFQGWYVWYVYIIADGVAWGIFSVLFLFTLWGDLSQSSSSEKAYVVGVIPFLLSVLLEVVFAPFMKDVNPITLFSFASFFLFIAVLPLVYAPETLSEKIMKDRELTSYVQKALETVNKKKGPKKQPKEKETDIPSSNEEEARKLAEKYY